MRRHLACLLCLLLPLLVVGCTFGPQGPRPFYVPVVEKPPDSSWPFVLPAAEPEGKDVKKEGPQIQVSARFIAGPAAELQKAGIDWDKPASVISGAEPAKVLNDLVRRRMVQLIAAPQVTTFPGQTGTITVTTLYNYVGDYQSKKAEPPRGTTLAPLTQQIFDGMALTLRVDLEGDQIVFSTVTPRMANALGMRTCKGWVRLGKEVSLLTWQEPVFLAAEGGLPAGERLVYRPGTTIAVPLNHTLKVTKAKVREQLDVPVEELDGSSLKFLSKLDKRGYPVPGRVVVLLSARLVREKPEPAQPPKP